MKIDVNEPIETVDQLAKFLIDTKPESAFVLVPAPDDQMHFIVINGQQKFLNNAADVMVQWLQHHLDGYYDQPTINRSERRKRSSARYRQ